jgi:aminocarboxymuconate-semialdehyde decarboxylase
VRTHIPEAVVLLQAQLLVRQNFEPNALQFAIAFAGADHVVLGTDYPHQIGDMEKPVKVIGSLPIPAEARASVLGGNAARLLKLEAGAASQR